MSTQNSTVNRDSQAYWNKRAATFTRFATGEYEQWLMQLLAPNPGEVLLDMGCATGTLAVPLARDGHHVHACDFAEAMLEILDERAAAEQLPISSHLLAWEDDWEAAGLGANTVDVAFASRSLMTEAVAPFIAKLDSAARSRAAVVVPASLPPSSDPRLLTYLGRTAGRPRIVRDVKRALSALGRTPVCATTLTHRPMRFSSFDEARADLRRLAGPEPLNARESRLFEAYATQHLTRKVVQSPTGEDTEMWILDYKLPVTWVFIGWRTDGSEWG